MPGRPGKPSPLLKFPPRVKPAFLSRKIRLRSTHTSRSRSNHRLMFLGTFSHPARWQPFLHAPLLLQSLLWVRDNAASVTEGIHELGKPGWFVNVYGYTTQPRELCAWENHTRTFDLQYMIDGLEVIDLIPVESLGAPTSYKADSDTEKFSANEAPFTQLLFPTGSFIFFLPGEAHRPKIAAAAPAALKKLVVKIPTDLLAS